MKRTALMISICTALLWQPAAAKAPQKRGGMAAYTALAPTTPWHLDYSAESCNLFRTFGTGENALTMKMEWFSPTPKFALELTGGKRLKPGAVSKLKFRFLPNGKEVRVSRTLYGSTIDNGTTVTTISFNDTDFNGGTKTVASHASPSRTPSELTPASTDEENAKTGVRVQALAFHLTNYGGYRLELGSMVQPMQAVRQCIDNLVKSWGLDPAVIARLQSRPMPINTPSKWLSPNDYPASAVRAGKSAFVAFRLMVDEQGRVTGCAVQNVHHDEAFSKLTCDLLTKRVRLTPAIDADGKPVAAYFISRASWIAG